MTRLCLDHIMAHLFRLGRAIERLRLMGRAARPERSGRPSLRLAGLVCGCVLAAGCASERSPNEVIHWPSQPRSIAFPAERLRQLARQEPPRPGQPWYAVRNEYRPAVTAGTEYPVLERSVTRTVDRQHSHGGRIHDDHHTHTYREQLRRTVR